MATKPTTSKTRRSPPKGGKPPSRRAAPHPDRFWIRTRPPSKRTRGFYVIRWIETHCVHTQGRWVTKPFRLLTWQKLFILSLFAVDPDGLRIARWALLGVPKKNGKSELAAALALYFLVGDGEPSPLVAVAAASDDQADLVFAAAKFMADFSPTLSRILETFDKEILFKAPPGGKRPPGKIRRLSAATGTNDGPSYSVVICDELHEWTGPKGEQLWNILTNSGGAREQPLILQITTAGWDRETICFKQYSYGKRVAQGKVKDRRYVFHWIEPHADDADWRSPKVWAAVNPSFGVTVRPDYLEDQLTKKPEQVFRRYFLNQWTSSHKRWIPMDVWDLGSEGREKLAERESGYVAIDGAARRDTTAVVLVVPRADKIVDAYLMGVFSPPGPGEVIDPELVKSLLRDLDRTHEILQFRYDPHLFWPIANELSEEGLVMVEVPQTVKRKMQFAQSLFDVAMQRRLRHGGDTVLRAHADAAVAKDRGNGWTLEKLPSSDPIDALVALGMAVEAADEHVEAGDLVTVV